MAETDVLLKKLDRIRAETAGKMGRAITYAEAGRRVSRMASATGRELLYFMRDNYETGITEAEAMTIIPPALRGNYRTASALALSAQETVNKRAKIGLKPIEAEFDEDKAANLARHVAETGPAPELVTLVEQNARAVVDDTLKKNATAHENAGLQVRVIRTYDGVGLANGKVSCEWCMDRVGEWEHVADAQAAGAFERHSGCGCEIVYQTVRLQWQKQGKDMNWRDIEPKDALARRRTYGL